jgi:hypothetical protein
MNHEVIETVENLIDIQSQFQGTALSMYLHFEPLGLTMISFLITWPRCLRPLMLVSRVDGMKAVVSGMWGQFKTLWSYFLSVGYVWVYFSVWMHFLFSYTFYRVRKIY